MGSGREYLLITRKQTESILTIKLVPIAATAIHCYKQTHTIWDTVHFLQFQRNDFHGKSLDNMDLTDLPKSLCGYVCLKY